MLAMGKKALALWLIALALLCGCLEVPTLQPSATPTESPTAAPKALALPPRTATPEPLEILGNVYIREEPAGIRTGALLLGETVTGICTGRWCRIAAGYIWRGCTNNNPAGLGCQTK